jgi:hypothetical protein
MIAGLALTLLPLRQVRAYRDRTFRALVLAVLLIWVVIFNYKAEPNTFVIAACGVALWYFAQARSAFNLAVLSLVFVCVCLSPIDLFPEVLRRHVVRPFRLMVVPCIAAWAVAVYELTFRRWRPRSLC